MCLKYFEFWYTFCNLVFWQCNQLNKNYFYSSSTVFISSLRDTKGKNPQNTGIFTVLYFPPHVMFSKADGFQFFSPWCLLFYLRCLLLTLFVCFYCTFQASRLLQDSKDKPTSLVVRETCQTPSTQQQQQPQQQQQQPAASPSQPSKPVEQSKVDLATPAVQQQGRDSVGFSKLKVLLRT